MNARRHAVALIARLDTATLHDAIAVVVGDTETRLAKQALRIGAIAAYVEYKDTSRGVLVERHTDSAALAHLIDRAIAIAAADAGGLASDVEAEQRAQA